MGKYVEWNDGYSVGVNWFDNQHKTLFDMVNRLHEGVEKGEGDEFLIEIFNGLLVYAASHFTEEERAMLETDYPKYESHKKEHEYLTAQVISLYNDLQAGEKIVSMDVLEFLGDWLKKHIAESDRKYGAHLIEKGYTPPAD